MAAKYVNLACGTTYINEPEWVNFDYAPGPGVTKANLLDRVPLPSGRADMVYSSHFLEHVPRNRVDGFLHECHRLLSSDGVLRLVLPDLENLARNYLMLRDANEHDKADFVVLEMVDQCVRQDSGGELGRFYRRMRMRTESEIVPENARNQMVDFIRERTGESIDLPPPARAKTDHSAQRLFIGLRRRIERYLIRTILFALPPEFRAQNVSLAGVGERHQWLWDFHQLRGALEAVGFINVQRCSADTSASEGFPFFPLDLDSDGQPRKGNQSMYVEARKGT